MKIDHQENCQYPFSPISIDFHRYYRIFLSELSFATYHAEGPAMATDFLLQEICFTCRYRKPALMVPFHNTLYQYHIHI